MGGLFGSSGQFRQLVFCFLSNIDGVYDKMVAFDQFYVEAIFVVFRVLIDIVVKLQGFQQRVEGIFVQFYQFVDVGDFKFGGLFVEQVEDL